MQTWNTMAITRILFLRAGRVGQGQAVRSWGPGGNQGAGPKEARWHQQQGDASTVDAGPVTSPLWWKKTEGPGGGRWWELEQGLGAGGQRDGGGGRGWLGTPEEALLEGGEAARLADEDVRDLAHLDADEEHGVAGVLLVQALPECLRARGEQKWPEPGGRGPGAVKPSHQRLERGRGERHPLPGLQDPGGVGGLEILALQRLGVSAWANGGSGQLPSRARKEGCRLSHAPTRSPGKRESDS